ncbi:hypothetical protein [Legionella spiritensis]|uniref:hypothetical protein n=1 Tax=Legionella spiritensis TaxID=452 RepID=UPI000F838EAC|nr:hypothetical protein [Legionella spiritensis]
MFNWQYNGFLTEREIILFTKKIASLILSSVVLTISSLIYFRSSTEDMDESSLETLLWLSVLSLLAGANEALEVYDHLKVETNSSASPPHGDVQQHVIAPSYSFSKVAVAGITSPMLVACSYAHILQGVALSKALYGEDGIYSTVLSTTLMLPSLVKFSVISLPHAYHALMGSRESFSLRVTNNKVSKATGISLPPLKWWVMLGVMTALHIPEGRLIASPIEHPLLNRLAKYGFALAESIPHINQLEQVPHNLNELRRVPKAQLAIYFIVGCVSGLIHSSQTILAVFANQENMLEFISPAFEFLVGFLESQQHLVPAINRFGLFGRSKSNQDETGKTMAADNATTMDIGRG